jgi:hypothetical protein
MKFFILALLLLASCSSWKQKDFEKSLEKPLEESHVDVPQQDQKILEKFEVKDTPAVSVGPEVPIAKVKKVKGYKKAAVATQLKPVIEVVKQLPKDYPEELIPLNEKGKKVWALYKPNHILNQKIFLDIHFLGVTVGKIMVMNKGRKLINGKDVWHFHARFKSAPFYSNIYELDDVVDTYVASENFMSVRYSLVQRETKQAIDDLQLYDRDVLQTFWFYKQKKSNGDVKNKDEKKSMPFYSVDPFSVVFFFQGLPLLDGERYEIPIVNKGEILMLDSLVEGRESIDTEIGKKKAIRVHATTRYTGDQLKSGDLYFWFSDDEERKLLKAKAKIKIGSVTADIVKD